jgi:hypothetical protein
MYCTERCGGLEAGDSMFVNPGGGTASNLHESDVRPSTTSTLPASSEPTRTGSACAGSDRSRSKGGFVPRRSRCCGERWPCRRPAALDCTGGGPLQGLSEALCRLHEEAPAGGGSEPAARPPLLPLPAAAACAAAASIRPEVPAQPPPWDGGDSSRPSGYRAASADFRLFWSLDTIASSSEMFS